MSEAFLHYIWQFQYFDKTNLRTTKGESLQIFYQGKKNTDAGPDFSCAKILIDNIQWVGNVEIHIQSSDWKTHRHDENKIYDSVILHVVWQDNKEIYRTNESLLPTLVLKERVKTSLIEKYLKVTKSSSSIPCAPQLKKVSFASKAKMLNQMLFERLRKKTDIILDSLKKNQHDWGETTYQYLVKYFGTKINSDTFLLLARSLPLKILQKHTDQPLQIEALLFGQSGLLDGAKIKDEYWKKLSKEYDFLSYKYSLAAKKLHYAEWKFLRLRPANFPTVRIAQLAALLTHKPYFLSRLLFTENIQTLRQILSTCQSSYWQKHYIFGKPANKKIGKMGKNTLDILIINAVIPLLAAFACYKDKENLTNRAVTFLKETKAEKNHLIKDWKDLGIKAKSAFDTQALIELYQNFCTFKKCLFCNIGMDLIR